MAKTAQDYPVTFGYLEKTTLNGKPYTHRGKDRATPVGTQVFEGNTNILTGNTGLSTGPHLHTQAGTDLACQNTIDPTPYEFKPGTVVALSSTAVGEWGKYVTLKVGSKFITYAHLSKVNTKLGQTLKGTDMATISQAEYEDLKRWKARGLELERKLPALEAAAKVSESRRLRLIAMDRLARQAINAGAVGEKVKV